MTATALLYADNDADSDEFLHEKITQIAQYPHTHNITIHTYLF